jgi:hypothetical protein
MEEEEPQRQQRRMNRRSIGGNCRSIQWSSLNKTETRQDQQRSIRRLRRNQQRRFWREVLQHRKNRRTVGVWRRSSSVREPQRLRDVGRAPDEPMLLKSRRGSSDGQLFSEPLANC